MIWPLVEHNPIKKFDFDLKSSIVDFFTREKTPQNNFFVKISVQKITIYKQVKDEKYHTLVDQQIKTTGHVDHQEAGQSNGVKNPGFEMTEK